MGNVFHAQLEPLPQPTRLDVLVPVTDHWTSSNRMVHASHALTVTFQMQAEPDVSRETSSFNKKKHSRVTRPCASVREKSTAWTEVSVSDACHTPELKETTPYAS